MDDNKWCPGGGGGYWEYVLGVDTSLSLGWNKIEACPSGGGGGGGNLQVCPPGGGDIINAKCVSRVFKYIYIYIDLGGGGGGVGEWNVLKILSSIGVVYG